MVFVVLSVSAEVPDSLRISTPSLDSLVNPKSQQLDSIRESFYGQADHLKASYKTKMDSLDASRTKITSKLDSLRSLNLNTDEVTHELDSIDTKRKAAVAALDKKMTALKEKAPKGVADLGLPNELQSKGAVVTQKMETFQLPVKDLNIPELSLPDNPLKNLDGFNTTASSPLREIGNVPDLNGLGKAGELGGELGNVGELGKVTEGVGDIKEVTGAVGDVNNLPGTLEGKAAEAAGLPATPDVKSLMGDVPQMPTNGTEAKEIATQQVQQAVNHFAGKEQVLQEALEKMAKLKKKYSSLNSLSDIPKRRPNEMRGKPLIERIIPSLTLQIHGRGEYVLVDFNVAAGYRFNGKLTAGLGWNHRVAYNKKRDGFSALPRVYGIRSFAEYKIGKGFSPRVEFEMMNAPVPPMIQRMSGDYSNRQWVPGAFVGIKKDYKFFGRVRGTSMVMLRLFHYEHKSPYSDVVNVRTGFEFPMRKKAESKKQKARSGIQG
ncbi:hypothetical protein DQQ10_12825 [Pseudochryseolinea flava]|uniref:Uncharacterized protein n=2 Tax=Pseudochryseolinea flava TaxID=2059302 RepID=A0A364Y2W3_9BACT|nr:hypothetical protein DQQ10_12825 [Pseudochryseolinea flava]